MTSLSSRFPLRATTWKLRTRTLALGPRPLLMGIVNATPDSFSDGGQFPEPQAAIQHGLGLVAQGADILDVGGESTRPYATPVDAAEELRRVRPVIAGLRRQTSVPISIDTMKAGVARAAIDDGAEIINDVTGFSDPQMMAVALASGAGVCAMHMQGTPQTMQDNPQYADVVREVFEYLRGRRDALLAAGIARERIALDIGIGFGKTHQHNVDLLAACHRFHELGCPLVVGPSRKGFIAKVLRDKEAPRDPATSGVACALAAQGVQIIRVHDVRGVRQALLLFEALGAIDGRVAQITD
jgi:dihydropteroate synthase